MTNENDWSTFEDDVRERTRPRGPRCSVGVYLEGLEPGTARRVRRALGSSGLSTVGIQRVLTERTGSSPSLWALSNHRRKRCGCWK